MSVACSPLFAWSIDCTHAWCQRYSNATSVRASLLYILMMRRAPWPSSTFWFDSNCFIGSSMRLSRWRDQVMLPATGGRLRGTIGSCFCFS